MNGLVRHFLKTSSGNVAMMFALAALPLLMAVGSAIDYSRTISARSKVGEALDSALLMAAKLPPMSDSELTNFLNVQIAALVGPGNGTWTVKNVSQGNNKLSADVSGHVDTTFLKAAKMSKIDYGTHAQVIREQKKVELALVLDNTGSMNSNGKIGALRDAANALVDIMYAGQGAAENVRTALVPFVTGVNIRASSFSKDWMDLNGDAEFHGINFEKDEDDKVNHFDLFDALASNPDNSIPSHWNGWEQAWKGCVEARPEPYDTDDTAPDLNNPDTLWVPWFWPDEPDTGNDFSNNYLNDAPGTNSRRARQRNTTKYGTRSLRGNRIDETPRNTSGPNKSCARPIVDLTNDTELLKGEIDAMRPHNRSGTNIAQGMAWGWRVLSPGEPFTEGVPYEQEDTLKAMVVLTDGENLIGNQDNFNDSDYNPYNYLDHRRLGTTSTSSARSVVNDKVEELCSSIKAKGIRVYTIVFKLNSESLQDLFRDCATTPAMYFNSPSNAALEIAFQQIAYDLSNLRLSE